MLVKFDSPDGSTYWGNKYYNNLVIFDLPDGSTSCCYLNYDILVNLTLQMAALIGVINIIIM